MESSSVQTVVADEVNRRIQKATKELEEKYNNGNRSIETSVDGPTGKVYKDQIVNNKKQNKNKNKQIEELNELKQYKQRLEDVDNEDIDDDEDEDLRQLRELRLKQIKNEHLKKLDNLGKGHGQYRDILQDEFLKEVTSSNRVICHFYHKEFPRCTIMDHHLLKLATKHIETKFIKIDSEKSPFFVEKLKIRTMPTLILFVDGLAIDKVIGFEGLADTMPVGKEDEWPTIRLARLLGEKNIIDKENIIDEDDIELRLKNQMENMRKNMYLNMSAALNDDDDDEFSD
eukprot:gene18474-24186_t